MLSAQGLLFGAALAFLEQAMKTRVYVDGMNLYYGALKRSERTRYKWLNLVELAYQMLPPDHVVERLRYFTSRVSGVLDPNAPARQNIYISALKTLPEVEVHFGNFLAKKVRRPVINLPVADRQIEAKPPATLPQGNHIVSGSKPQVLPVRRYINREGGKRIKRKSSVIMPNTVIAEFHTMEEKGSDVNLAAHLLNDAWQGLFDAAAVISNDTDLETPIRMVKEEMKKQIFIICPAARSSPRLRDAASNVRHIGERHLRRAQFPDVLTNDISKPKDW